MIDKNCCNYCSRYKDCDYTKKENRPIKDIHITQKEDECICMESKCLDVKIGSNDNIRVDLTLNKENLSKLWGQITDDDGNYLCGAIVTLLKPKYVRGVIEYFPISTTISDYMGFYQFRTENLEKGLTYKVLANKS